MTKQHNYSVKKEKIRKFQQLLVDCYQNYELIQEKMNTLDVSVKNTHDYEWLHFVYSVEEFDLVIKSITKNIE